jgi:hypothetical protein
MYHNFIPYLYEAHVLDDTPPVIRSLILHWKPLVFHTWKNVGGVIGNWWTLSGTVCLTTYENQRFLVQYNAPDDGRCRPKYVELHISRE